jgi:hypothetical protein
MPLFTDTDGVGFVNTDGVGWQKLPDSSPIIYFQNAGNLITYVGGILYYIVLYRDADGAITDVTAQCIFTSSAPSIATVNTSGEVSGVTIGNASITATYNGLSCSTVCSVVQSGLAFPDVDFPVNTAVRNAEERTLAQFRQSIVLLSIMMAFIEEAQVLQDAVRDVMSKRTIFKASGENLNVLGRIVVQLRGLINLTDQVWFAPDTPGASVDQARVWVLNAPQEGSIAAPDVFSKLFIQAKIFRNNVKYGSIPEVQQFVYALFGIPVSVILTGPLTIDLVVPDSISSDVFASLSSLVRLQTCESVYLLPVPAGVKIDNVIKFSDYSV